MQTLFTSTNDGAYLKIEMSKSEKYSDKKTCLVC